MKQNDLQLLQYFFLWLVLSFMVAFSFYGNFRIWESFIENTCYKLFAINSFALLPSSRFNVLIYSRLFGQNTITGMPSLIRKK